jgi:hypothetical protein
MTPQEVLIKAAELLESSPRAWAQDGLAFNSERNTTSPRNPLACSWCALGAIAMVQELPHIAHRYDPAATLLASHLGVISIADWNDNPLRTREEVIAAMSEAAKLQTVTS